MSRTITTAAELDALPVGSEITDRQSHKWSKRQDGNWRHVSKGLNGLLTSGELVLIARGIVHDPSAPAPAPPVVPEAAAEAAASALYERMRTTTPNGDRYPEWDVESRQAEPWLGDARAALTAALPHLTPEQRQVTSAEGLAALPIGSVVLDLHGDAGLIDGIGPEGSVLFAEMVPMPLSYATKHFAPFTVLYTPKEDR